jgi:hypothetical protein
LETGQFGEAVLVACKNFHDSAPGKITRKNNKSDLLFQYFHQGYKNFLLTNNISFMLVQHKQMGGGE